MSTMLSEYVDRTRNERSAFFRLEGDVEGSGIAGWTSLVEPVAKGTAEGRNPIEFVLINSRFFMRDLSGGVWICFRHPNLGRDYAGDPFGVLALVGTARLESEPTPGARAEMTARVDPVAVRRLKTQVPVRNPVPPRLGSVVRLIADEHGRIIEVTYPVEDRVYGARVMFSLWGFGDTCDVRAPDDFVDVPLDELQCSGPR